MLKSVAILLYVSKYYRLKVTDSLNTKQRSEHTEIIENRLLLCVVSLSETICDNK